MNVFNSAVIRDSAPTMYGFPRGHVFAICDPNEVLYQFITGTPYEVLAHPVSNPELVQRFSRQEFDDFVRRGVLDPRLAENRQGSAAVRHLNPDVGSARDLSDDEKTELNFYLRLCLRISQMYRDREIALTDASLSEVIPMVMSELTFGARTGDGAANPPPRRRGRPRATRPVERSVRARKAVAAYATPAPSTVRRWIRELEQHDWNILALRDHRKGRVGHRAPSVSSPEARNIMSGWVQAYLDRNRPSVALLYRLMVGSTGLAEENATRHAKGFRPMEIDNLRSFAQVNAARAAEGLPPLPVPSKSTFERAIQKLDKFEVAVAREGLSAARHRFKVAGRRTAVLAPGERVQIDCWRVQLSSLRLPDEFWDGLPPEQREDAGCMRLTLCVAIDEATRVVLGMRLGVNPNSELSQRTLEMVCRDKNDLALAAGCKSTWHHTCTPFVVATDSGSEFIDADFRAAVSDLGITNEIGPARHPDARGVVERFFRTLDSQLMPMFQGRTFSSVRDRGEYDAQAFANVLVGTLSRSLVRYVVDVYHNSPHTGLGGMTPNDAWAFQSERYGVLPPPSREKMHAVFGFRDRRRIQNSGIRFLGLFYRSEELARLRAKVGQADVRLRANLDDLGTVWVSENRAGAPWIVAECDLPMAGIPAARWIRACDRLRARYADVSRLSANTVAEALAALRAEGQASAEARGIGPSTVSRDDILRQERDVLRHFGFKEAAERGRAFDGFDEPLPEQERFDPNEDAPLASEPANGRHRRGIAADFFGED